MLHKERTPVSAVLDEANEQVNIYAAGRWHLQRFNLSVTLETPEDWLAWMRHDADVHEQMARDKQYPEMDQAGFWEDAALLRKFSLALMDCGVKPSEIEWNEPLTQEASSLE